MPAILSNVKKILGFEILGRYKGEDVLVLMGERSAVYECKTFKPVFPNLKCENVKIIPGAGHWVHADKPLETLDALIGFITKIDRSCHA